jgi:hypothetical protein
MMELRLVRFVDTGRETRGMLMVDDMPFCFTIEPTWRGNARNVSCIPLGEYPVEVVRSPKFGEVVGLREVPDRDAILIHPGNKVEQTEGCILPYLPGASEYPSTTALKRLLHLLRPEIHVILKVESIYDSRPCIQEPSV